MSVEQNKTVIRRLIEEVWNQGNLDAIEELHSPQLVDHSAPPERPPGAEGIRQFVSSLREPFPDFQVNIEHLIAEDDMVVLHWKTSGTHRGEYLGVPATGKRLTSHGVNIFRMENSRIAEDWGVSDDLGVLQQLGVLPTALVS